MCVHIVSYNRYAHGFAILVYYISGYLTGGITFQSTNEKKRKKGEKRKQIIFLAIFFAQIEIE